MAEWDALYTNPEWEVPSTAYAYRVMVQLKEVYKLEEVINLLYDWTEDTTEKYVWKVEWRAVGKNGDRFRTEDWERWTQGTPIEAVEKVTW